MNSHATDDVEARVDRLEREMRRWRVAAVVIVGLFGLVVLVAAATPEAAPPAPMADEEVSYVLRGPTAPTAKGPVADELRARRFLLVDEAGKTRALLGFEEGDATLKLYHQTGRQAASLRVLPSGTSALYLAGKDGIDRAWLEVSADAPALVFRDEAIGQRVVLGGFTLHYTTGVSERRPTASLVLFDKDGKVLFKAP